MDLEAIELELETDYAAQGEPLKTCSGCGFQTFRKHCPTCETDTGEPVPLTGHAEIDEMVRRGEQGEDISNFLAKFDDEQWEPVEPCQT